LANLEEILLPDIGDFSDVPVIEVLVGPGDRIEPEQSLLTLESDKATMEIPAPKGGVVRALRIEAGDRVNAGDALLSLETDDETDGERATGGEEKPDEGEAPAEAETAKADGETETASAEPATREGAAPAQQLRDPGGRPAPVRPRPADMASIAQGRTPHASPAVRRFARELGVDLRRVKGSGRKGRIVKDDVQRFVQQALRQGGPGPASGAPWQMPAAPEVDFSRFGPTEQAPLSRIKRISGGHLHRSWLTVPHVTQFDEADITELEAFRRAEQERAATREIKLTFLPFLLKAVATGLNAQPNLKASLTPDGEGLILKHYTHVGVAVDTPDGLVVPVVRDVDKKGVLDLARELTELSGKARAGKLLPGDMQGGCFTISSLGGIGGTAFTPIVNAPEVAILGVSKAETRPVWDGQAFAPRRILPLSLSYDHRVVDGAEGVRFTRLLGELLGDIRRLLL